MHPRKLPEAKPPGIPKGFKAGVMKQRDVKRNDMTHCATIGGAPI
jgi:hypothetical protein